MYVYTLHINTITRFIEVFRNQRIKELKKLRQQLAYSSFACTSSWIMLTSLMDLYLGHFKRVYIIHMQS